MPRLCRKCRHRGSARQHRADTAATHPVSCGTPSGGQEFAARRARLFCPRVKRQSCSVDTFFARRRSEKPQRWDCLLHCRGCGLRTGCFFAHGAESRVATLMLFCSTPGQKAWVPGLSAPMSKHGRATPKLFRPTPGQKHSQVVFCASRQRSWEPPPQLGTEYAAENVGRGRQSASAITLLSTGFP